MGKIQKLQDTAGTTLYPVTVGEAVVVGSKKLSDVISEMDASITGTPGAGKTLTAFSETDGKVSATFGNISITKSLISDFPSTITPSSHTHGNITNDGKIGSTASLAVVTGTAGAVTTKDMTVASPTASTTTSTTFIDTVSLGTDGLITATKKTLPSASTTVAGITKVGASGGAAAYSHSHSYAGSSSAGGAADSVANSLTVGSKTFDGSAAVTITAADLGLSNSMHFLGAVTAAPSTASVTINSKSVTAVAGDVVVNTTSKKEYVFDGTNWIELGDESSYALKTTTVSSGPSTSAGVSGSLGGTVNAPTITISVTGGSVASGNTSVVTGGTVFTALKNKIEGLDATGTDAFGAGKTISAWSETDGIVSITSLDISITSSLISDKTDSYSSTGTVVVTGKAVAAALGTLDVTGTSAFGAGKTISAWSETDGKVSITSQDISITKSQVSDFSHAHGNLTNDGKIGSTADYAVVTTTAGAVTAVSLAVSAPTASGNATAFIDSVSQSSTGKITATKKNIPVVSTTANGLMSSTDKTNLNTLVTSGVLATGKYLTITDPDCETILGLTDNGTAATA